MLLIYSDSLTNRKKYIFNVLFFNILGVDFTLTDDRARFDDFAGPKFAYGSYSAIPANLIMPSCGLLDEIGIRRQSEDVVDWNGYKLFFPVSENYFSPCDIFSLSFYLITRYEEYLDDRSDIHGRFLLENSAAYRHGFYRIPLVHLLALDFAEKLKSLFPHFEYKKPEKKLVYTCDVDIAYKYRGKGFFRWSAGVLRSLFHGDFVDARNFLRTAAGMQVNDPFDVYDITRNFSQHHDLQVIHFIPTGSYGKFDKNIPPETTLFKNLVKRLAEFSEIGLHPSYGSFGNPVRLEKEKSLLERATDGKIMKSRQHFLLFRFPETPRQLSGAGITDDYTLGWTGDVGFRCSIAVPYHFYDLQKETETQLLLHPLIVMDVALKRIKGDEQERERAFAEVAAAILNYGGEFVILSHNTESSLLPLVKRYFFEN